MTPQLTPKNDVAGLQRAVVELVTDDDARAGWMSDPGGFAALRLTGPAAEVLVAIDPGGIQAMAMSHFTKKARFDYLHRLHHELEARKAAEAAGHAQPTHHRDGAGRHAHPDRGLS
jgi:hypothetical protein